MRKTTVQECLAINVGIFPKMKSQIFKNWQGILDCGAGYGSIGFCLLWEFQGPILRLSYGIDEERVEIPIRLVATRTQFGGRRWWLKCPLSLNGTPCHRRAGKLFLPPGERLFGCRECHCLAYQSSQEAHQMDRLNIRMGMPSGRT